MSGPYRCATTHPRAVRSQVCLYCMLQVASACSFWSVSWKKPKQPQLQSTKTKLRVRISARLISSRDHRQDEPVPACRTYQHQCHQRAQQTALHTLHTAARRASSRHCSLPGTPPFPLHFPFFCTGKDMYWMCSTESCGRNSLNVLPLVKKMKSLCVAGHQICHTPIKFESPAGTAIQGPR